MFLDQITPTDLIDKIASLNRVRRRSKLLRTAYEILHHVRPRFHIAQNFTTQLGLCAGQLLLRKTPGFDVIQYYKIVLVIKQKKYGRNFT